MDKELRSLHVKELRVATSDGNRSISGMVTYNTPSADLGGFTEIIAPGAFASSISGDVLLLRDHQPTLLMGRTKSGTLSLSDTAEGLQFTCRLPNTTSGNDLAESIDRRDLDGVSFGFYTNDDNWVYAEGTTVRTIIKAELLEISPCSFAAYPANSVSIRSCPVEIQNRLSLESRATKKTCKVDGDELTADCFAYVGDPDKTDTWKLPYKFSDEEKTKDHIRNALARFNQTEGIPESEKDKVWDKLLAAAKEYDITVSAKRSIRSMGDGSTDEDDLDCTCDCPSCIAGDCLDCSDDPCTCVGCTCNEARCMQLKQSIAELDLL